LTFQKNQYISKELKMSGVVRLSFSIEKSLWERLQNLVEHEGYANRSEFIRDLIRDHLVEKQWEENEEAIGTITFVYNHHIPNLNDKILDIQHKFINEILTSTHIHLDNQLCAETILVRGKAHKIQELCSALRKQKGVLHASISISSTGRNLM